MHADFSFSAIGKMFLKKEHFSFFFVQEQNLAKLAPKVQLCLTRFEHSRRRRHF